MVVLIEFYFFSLRYLQNETDLPATPPENNAVLTPNMVSSLNFPNESKNVKQEHNVPTQGKIFNIGVKEHKIKLPALDLQKRILQKSSCSLDNCNNSF